MTHGLYPNGASPLSYIMLFPRHGTRERVVFDNLITRSHTHLIISIRSIHDFFPLPERSHNGARASCLGRNTAGASNRAEPAENRRAQRRHRLERPPRIPLSKSHGRLRSGVDLFGRASRGYIATLKITKDPFRVSIPIIKKIVLVY